MTLRDKCVRDWCPQYTKQLPVPMKCKRIYSMDSDTGTHKYISFTSIGSEGNVVMNGATLYFDYNIVILYLIHHERAYQCDYEHIQLN